MFRLASWSPSRPTPLRVLLVLYVVIVAAFAVPASRRGILAAVQRAVDRLDRRWLAELAEAEALLARGNPHEAERILAPIEARLARTAVEAGYESARGRLLLLLAQAREAQGDEAAALETYDALAALAPDAAAAYFARAQAVSRLRGRWTPAPEVREAYAEVLRRDPLHLASLRALLELEAARGDHAAVVRQFESYLGAFHLQRVRISLGDSTVTASVPVDGQWHTLDLPLGHRGGVGPLAIETGGLCAEPGSVSLVAPIVTGVAVPSEGWGTRLDGDWQPRAMIRVGDRFRAEDAGSRLTALVPGDAEIARIELRLRLYKPVDEATWGLVQRSYRALLGEHRMQAVAEQLCTEPTIRPAERIRGTPE